ncbi:hypothetical protein CK203_072667 [Vitis vinifera]|uniref:Uncharacterized protein n=1 Tax=Vitis vinifera TaxID=29760 RepID=A0A438EZ40_VITVI|nr:hypothetical protein CK203_072667 [Vitis vinifera]
MAPSHRKKIVGKRVTIESSPPGDRKIKRRKRGTTHSGFNVGASSSQHSRARQRDRKSQLSNSMRTRLGPQEPGRPRPPAATTWAARLDPVVNRMVQNVLPHRDPMVTPMVRNVHSHLAVQ